MRATPSTSSGLDSSAARPYRRTCASGPGCSSRSRLRASAPFTVPLLTGSAADRVAMAESANTGVASAARPSMTRMTGSSASRCVPTATTTRHMSCGTRTRGGCGRRSRTTSTTTLLPASAAPAPACGTACASPTPKSPSTKIEQPSTSMPWCASTVRTGPTIRPRSGQRPMCSRPWSAHRRCGRTAAHRLQRSSGRTRIALGRRTRRPAAACLRRR